MKQKPLLFFIVIFLSIATTPIVQASTPQADEAVLALVKDSDLENQLIVDYSVFEKKAELLDRALKTLYYLETPEAKEFYAEHFGSSIKINSVRKSLLHFYLILLLSKDVDTFISRLKSHFSLYQSIGQDGKGTVKFTGYFQPIYEASLSKDSTYRFPIFKKPADFESWSRPHPSRVQLEGYRGLTPEPERLAGKELAWLKNRFDVFMIQLQGSAILQLPDGKNMAVGFDAGTEHPFRGVPRSFMQQHGVAWHRLDSFFLRRPDLLDEIMSRNNRFIFFKAMNSPDAVGSIGVPVLAERSIATDRLKLPPGAVAVIKTRMPVENGNGRLSLVESSRFVLNLDTGSAIKGPGRVDIFMGTGEEARLKASSIYNNGELYYLFLEDSRL